MELLELRSFVQDMVTDVICVTTNDFLNYQTMNCNFYNFSKNSFITYIILLIDNKLYRCFVMIV